MFHRVSVTCEICGKAFTAIANDDDPVDVGWYHDECLNELYDGMEDGDASY